MKASEERELAFRHLAMYVGDEHRGHLYSVRQALFLAALTPVFHPPTKVSLLLDTTKFVLGVWSAGLTRPYEQSIRDNPEQDLRDRLSGVSHVTASELRESATIRRTGCPVAVNDIVSPTVVAYQAYIGITSGSQFLFQTYIENEAQAPARILSVNDASFGDHPAPGLCYALDYSSGPLSNIRFDAESILADIRSFTSEPVISLGDITQSPLLDILDPIAILLGRH